MVVAFAVISTAYLASIKFDFKIPQNANVLVLGNSHPECAIDESLMPNAYNLAQSGSGYFYDYLKAKQILKANSQVDTLIIGYSYGDISGNMDLWFTDSKRIKFKIRNHFFLFSFEDYVSLFKGNPIGTLVNTPQTIYHNLKVIRLGLRSFGGYKHLTRNGVKDEIESLESKDKVELNQATSNYQKKYLLKVYNLCKENNVQLVLLATPMHKVKIKKQQYLKNNYCQFAKEKMPKAILIDHTNFAIPELEYADMAHLNNKGARRYSSFLSAQTLKNTSNCGKLD